MDSEVFDPYLAVLDEAGNELVSNADADLDFTASVATSLAPGVYYVFANTWDDNGAYTVTTSFADPLPCPAQDARPGDTIQGALTAGGCRVMDLVAPSADDTYGAGYRVTVDSPTVLTADLASSRSGAALFLFADNGQLVSTGTTNGAKSQVITLVNPGAYTLVANDVNGRTATFTLGTSGAAPPNCAAAELLPDGSASDALASTGCHVREVVAGSTGASYVRRYRVALASAGTLRLEASSRVMGAALIVTDPDGRRISTANTDVDGTARIRVHLGAGTYIVNVIAAIAGQTGAFDLTSAFTADGGN